MSIPENALIICNEEYGNEGAAYSDWQTLRTDFLKMFPDTTAEELDELEATPQEDTRIYRLERMEDGLYMAEIFHNVGYGRMRKARRWYSIQWDEDGKHGTAHVSQWGVLDVSNRDLPGDKHIEEED